MESTNIQDDYERAGAIDTPSAHSQNSQNNQLPQSAIQGLQADDDDEMTYLQSMWLVCKRSTPTILTMVFFQMVALLNIYYVGQMSTELLAGVGLGSMLLNVLVFAVTMGLNGTIETFVAWSYGQGDKAACGMHLNRAKVIVTIFCMPVMLLFCFIDKILIGCQQDPEIALDARNYVVWTIPGWFFLVQFDCTKRFLQTIHMSVISTTTQCVTTLLHVGWGYLFIIHLDMGVAGAALALNITYTLNFFAQETYIYAFKWSFFKEYMQPLFRRSNLSWKGSKEFLKLGVPGTMMQCAEWWAFELLAIFAGMLGKHQLAAQVAVINIIGLLFMFPLGVQFCAAANVGEMVGKGNVRMAKKHAITHIIYAVVLMSIIMLLLRVNQDAVAGLFTNDEEDIYYIKETLGILSVYIVLDAVHGVNTGIVRALGKQFKASVATLCCYYIFGMPLAICLGFKLDMGVVGFWLGFTVALTLQDILVTIIIIRADWDIGTKLEDDLKDNLRKISDLVVDQDDATITSKSLLSKEHKLEAKDFQAKEF